MQQGKGEEVTGTILKELQQYVIYHFNTEESWMKMISYPDLAKHQQEHQEAMQKVNKFIVEYERGSKTISIDLLKFLGDWLQNHILQTDRSYMPYLKGKI
jgi:hemerythrin-like metal-binding protein